MTKTSWDEIRRQTQGPAHRWQALIGINDIKSKADLARYFGVSRSRVTQVLKRLSTKTIITSHSSLYGF